MGVSRSVTAVIAYLMRKQRRRRDEGLADVKDKRKGVRPSTDLIRQLAGLGVGSVPSLG